MTDLLVLTSFPAALGAKNVDHLTGQCVKVSAHCVTVCEGLTATGVEDGVRVPIGSMHMLPKPDARIQQLTTSTLRQRLSSKREVRSRRTPLPVKASVRLLLRRRTTHRSCKSCPCALAFRQRFGTCSEAHYMSRTVRTESLG